MQMDYYFLSIVAIFTSVIGAAYYLRIIKFVYFYDDVFIPHYINNNELNTTFSNIGKEALSLSVYNKGSKRVKKIFFDDSFNDNNNIPMLPSNSLSLIIALLTNISLFYILKPYILINAIYMITIPLFQT
jgi:hypothetical protein